MKWNYLKEKINYFLNYNLSLKTAWTREFQKNNNDTTSLTKRNPNFNKSWTSYVPSRL